MRFPFTATALAFMAAAPAAHADAIGEAQAARPRGNPGEWATTADYPAEALTNRVQGTTGFELAISPLGIVERCEVTLSSGSSVLDAKTCELVIARARFQPASDPAGRPIAGSYRNKVRWVVPTMSRRQPEPYELVTSAIVEADGTFTNCRVERASANVFVNEPGLASSPRQCTIGNRTTPFTDESGKPVRRRVITTGTVTIEPVP